MAYFDYNATTPLHPAARDAWIEASERHWQNPSSPCGASARVKSLLDEARERAAARLGCAADRIVFNSGATEGANALMNYVAACKELKTALALLSPTEHPATLGPAAARFCDRKRWLRVDGDGRIDLDDLERKLSQNGYAVVSVMAANNETGVIQPWPEIASLCRGAGVIYHCDAAQWIGKMPAGGLDDCGFVTFSAHKFGGPKGVGGLVIPEGRDDFRSLLGGEHERGFRAGTENYPGIAAMLAAWEACEKRSREEGEARCRIRRVFEERVVERIPGVRVAGGGAKRLWNTVSLVMPEFENHRWVTKLDRKGFQVSTGSACATGSDAPSHVLAAMGFSPEEARRTIRLSAGWETAETDWEGLVAALVEVYAELREDEEGPSLTQVVSI